MKFAINTKYLIIFLIAAVAVGGCGIEAGDNSTPLEDSVVVVINVDSVRNAKLIAENDVFPLINYQRVYIENYKKLKEIRSKYAYKSKNLSAHKAFTTLNRKELRYVRIKDTVIVPDSVIADMRAYSVFPPYYPGAADLPKIIVISNAYLSYACYEYGRIIRLAAVNSGKQRTPSYPGRYALVWKEKDRRSSLDSNWHMPYNWNFHAAAGSAFHKFSMPGRPASHSCIRQFMSDAKWLYYWGEGVKFDTNRKQIPMSGTPVLIIDNFDFSRKKYGPWLDLANNKDVWLDLPENPMQVEEALIPYSQIPEASRWGLRNKERYLYAEDTLRARGVIRPGVKLIATVNYNELRRKKALKLAEEEEAKRKLQAEEDKLNIDLIKDNLEKLDNKPVEVIENPGPAVPTTISTDPAGEIETNKPDESNPDKNNPDKNNPDKNNPDKNNPDKNNPDKNNPDKNNPDKNNPDKSNPDKSNPDKNNPDINNPDINNPDKNNNATEEKVKEKKAEGKEEVKPPSEENPPE